MLSFFFANDDALYEVFYNYMLCYIDQPLKEMDTVQNIFFSNKRSLSTILLKLVEKVEKKTDLELC